VLKTFLDQITIQLRHSREARGLSQEQIASQLKIGLRTYQRYEAGESCPPIDFLYQFATLLGISFQDLISAENKCKNIEGFRIIEKQDFPSFSFHPDIVNSKILSIAEGEFFQLMKDTNKLEHMLKDKNFMNSDYALAIGTPKLTLVNPRAMKDGGHPQFFPTPQVHEDKDRLGKMWAYLIEKNPPGFEHLMMALLPKGPSLVMGRYLFENYQHKYFVFGVLDFDPTSKLRNESAP
jgi:transcriptional regulator with XRE-family HTH domain